MTVLDMPRLSSSRRALLKPFVRWGGTLWLVGASLTWTFCAPPHASQTCILPPIEGLDSGLPSFL
jgi:hypothetical protein